MKALQSDDSDTTIDPSTFVGPNFVQAGDPDDTDTDIESIPSIKKPSNKLGSEFAKVKFSLGDEDLDALNDDCKYLRHCLRATDCRLQTVAVPFNNKGVFR